MGPLAGGFPTWLPSLAEIEHRAALGVHCLLTFRPGGSEAVGAEEPFKGQGILGMRHTHDPLAPGQILDWFPWVSPFPVQNARDLMSGSVEQAIGRSVLTGDEHASDPVLHLYGSTGTVDG